jgi:hypothetical protein
MQCIYALSRADQTLIKFNTKSNQPSVPAD